MIRKKKVLFIITSLSGGGAEHVARKNIECLSNRNDYELAVLTTDKEWFGNKRVQKLYLADFRKVSNFKKIHDMIYLRSNFYNALKFLREFQPDIIHIHDFIPFSPSLLKAVKYYKKEFTCKVVMTHHTYSYLCTNDSLYNYNTNCICEECAGTFDFSIITKKCTGNRITSVAKYIQKKYFIKDLRNIVDLHISPSTFLKEKLLKFCPNLQVEVVYNPCIDRIKDISEITKDIDKQCIVYFGRVNREKNIELFTEAFCEVNTNLKLLIIGTGNSEDKIKEIMRNNSHLDIEFINKFLPTNQLEKELRRATYFVIPSVWYENSPVSIVEGINNGIIPIANQIGGMKELINLFELGYLIDTSNKEGIKNLLCGLSNKSLDSFNFEISRKTLKKFTIEEYQIKINDLYTSLVN